jgi:hypothetical protein
MTTFICEVCGRKCSVVGPEAEAEAELAKNFPGFEKEDCGLVCDDCYHDWVELLRSARLTKTHAK